MQCIQALNEYDGNGKAVFVAGGISGCPDWQKNFIDLFRDEDIVLLNPRRAVYSDDTVQAAKEQIEWEHRHLRQAQAVSFWFPAETLCPITLFELGAWLMTDKPVFIGVHPDYKRRLDVETQAELARPGIKIVYDLPALAEQVRLWLKNK